MRTAQTLAVLVGFGAAGYWLRRTMLRWGAHRDEVRGPWPGADLVPGGRRGSIMATTVDAPPARVWPWLVQMGFDRAGWYSWDRLDRGGTPSASTLHPEWQSLSLGQHLRADREGKHWFEVAALEPGRFLALRAAMTPTGRQYESARPRPRYFSDGVWSFELKEWPGGRTRLVVRSYGVTRPRWLGALTGWLFWEPAHWIMQRRQFANLKRRAEHAPAPSEALGTPSPAAPGWPG
jgi:proline iminopeptidase